MAPYGVASRALGIAIAGTAALLAACPTEAAEREAGEAIFHGGGPGIAVVADGLEVPAGRLACGSCHGRDGLGGGEGAYPAPPIAWRRLAADSGERRAYDRASLARLLKTGRNPEGRALARLMPRYRFTSRELDQLVAYLQVAEDEQLAGITNDRVRFAVPYGDGQQAAATHIQDRLAAALERLGSPRLFGRRIVFEAVPAPEALAGAFAAVMTPIGDTWFFEEARRARLPVIAPMHGTAGSEAESDVRALFASRRDQLRELDAAAPAKAAVLHQPGSRHRDDRLFLERRSTSLQLWLREKGVELIAPQGLDAVGPVPQRLPTGARIFSTVDGSARTGRLWLAAGATLVLSDPRPPGDAPRRRPDLDRLADAAVRSILAALETAGRETTRSRFMAAFGGVAFDLPDWPAVDFSRSPLTGSGSVSLLTLRPGVPGPGQAKGGG